MQEENKVSTTAGRILKWESEVPVPSIPNANYASVILDALTQYGEDPALVDGITERTYTYGDVCRMIYRIQNGLRNAGVSKGESVMLLSRNTIEFPGVLLGIIYSGATCVPVNPALTREELAHVARVSEARWVFTTSNVVQKVEGAFSTLESGTLKQIWIIDDGVSGASYPSLHDLLKSNSFEGTNVLDENFDSSKDVAMMPFSSGTTGLPKGVMLSHKNLLTSYLQTRYFKSLYPDMSINIFERTLHFLPMYHNYGYNILVNAITSGGKTFVMPKFSPQQYLKTVDKHKITYSPMVPYIIKYLLDTPHVEKYDLSSLIFIGIGASPISESSLETFMGKIGALAQQGYGMTEACATVSANGGPSGSKPESVGRVSPFIEAKIIDKETGRLLPEGEEGELCVRGPSIMLGYANDPEATADTIDSEGWLHTGDLFYYDDENFLYITDRIKDLIKVKGYQVSPTEIENILKEVEGVGEVAVAGVPHERLGEAPRAWVVPAEGATVDPQALIKHVAGRVVSYKQLAGGVELVKNLPKNHLGKIVRRELKKSYQATRSKL